MQLSEEHNLITGKTSECLPSYTTHRSLNFLWSLLKSIPYLAMHYTCENHIENILGSQILPGM